MSNLVTHGILHQTLIRPTVAKYHSKVNSSFISANTLYQDVGENQAPAQAQNLLLAGKYCGNNFCLRKRKVAMERHRQAAIGPHAVSSPTDQASEISGNFLLDGNIELQFGVTSSATGLTQVDIQVSSSSDSLVLHWGVICDQQGKWVTPSRRPDGTKVYKNRALRTPFVKTGSRSILKIEIDDPAAQAIEFIILDEARNKWYKNNGGNFHIKLPLKVVSDKKFSVPEDLVQIQAYLRWERKGKQIYTPEQEKEEYEAARTELLEELARGTSIEGLYVRLKDKTLATEVKEPSASETKTIPDELVQVQAYIRWEKAGKPNYSPDQQLREFEEARKELLAELEKGTSVDEIKRKIFKGEIQTKVAKQLKTKNYFLAERIQRKERDLMQIINRHVAENIVEQDIDVPKALTVIEQYSKTREEQNRGLLLNKEIIKLGNNDLLVLVTKDSGKTKVHLATDFKSPVTLHWALSRTTPGEWLVPDQSGLPPGSVAVNGAAETQLRSSSSSDPFHEVQSLDIEVEDNAFKGMPFVLMSSGKWIKNNGSNFYIEFGSRKRQIQKDNIHGKGTAKFLLDKIAKMEDEAQRSFMHRFNIAADLIDQAKDDGQLGLAGILVWMRFMATRQLIWNKNYNVKPR